MRDKEHPFVRSFMTHRMGDAEILALSTGRERELSRILAAVERSRKAAPGSMQHLVLYGARGFGKSFMARRVEVELRKEAPTLPYLLLPEEQHNLQRSPHAFLELIAANLEHRDGEEDLGFTETHFRWPKKGEEQRQWDQAAVRLEAALDRAFADGKGPAIVVVENFDTLLATLFKEPKDEQRLRRWLDRPGNRVMLFATATGTVDMDYERPLFKAFETVRLSPWSGEDCLDYFARQRAAEGKPPLDGEQTAKALAVADFIGGTPRLAQLLGQVLDNRDAMTVVETMSALADKLAEYYRRRIEDLPPLARGLLDALIRGGEPASQTELAKRVEAEGQSTIARVMQDLQRADLIRGAPAPDSRETLYKVVDRVFVHYYRERQGSRAVKTSPLSTILEFLKSFYSRDEQLAQAFKHLEAGRPAEARVFNRIALEGEPSGPRPYADRFPRRLAVYCEAVEGALRHAPNALTTLLEESPEEVFHIYDGLAPSSSSAAALFAAVKAQALYRMGQYDKAEDLLEEALQDLGVDSIADVIVAAELSAFCAHHLRIPQRAALIGSRLSERDLSSLPAALGSIGLRIVVWSLGQLGRHEESVETAGKAIEAAQAADSKHDEAVSLRYMAWSFGQLGRHEEAVETAGKAIEAAQTAEDKGEEAGSLLLMAWSLGRLGRHEEAVEIAGKAIEAAQAAEDKGVEAASLRYMAWSLRQLGRHEEAAETASKAIEAAQAAEVKGEEAASLRIMALSQIGLGRYPEAWKVITRGLGLAREADAREEFSRSVACALEISCFLGREEAVPLFEEWLVLRASVESAEAVADPHVFWADLFVSTTVSGAFPKLDRLIDRHEEEIKSASVSFYFPEAGPALALFAERVGRAKAYSAFAKLLPRVARFLDLARQPEPFSRWLSKLLSDFAKARPEPGLLRDLAHLLIDSPDLGTQDQAALLTAIAEVDEAEVPERVLARLDPDMATLIRRLRDLPEPEVKPGKKGRKRRK